MTIRFGLLAGRLTVGSYEYLVRIARAAEAAGYDSFFRSDHQLNLDGDYSVPITECWSTLAGLARDTTRVRLGSLISPVTFRHPTLLARTVTAIDHMSAGRIELGIGLGAYDPDNVLLGVPLPPVAERAEILVEQLAIVQGLWTSNDFSYEGRHYTLDHARLEPHPFQQPHPPVIVGGKGKPRGIRIAAAWADEYNLDDARPAGVRAGFRLLEEELARCGRPPGAVRRSLLVDWPEAEDRTVDERLEAYEDAGVDRVFLMLPDRTRAFADLERFAQAHIH
jgi:alkanesulfonate monooxygenase SsuD/methylene tetrahydromethanopterin reductase-like flavin-dependent oxidoreductase (luciferase family)